MGTRTAAVPGRSLHVERFSDVMWLLLLPGRLLLGTLHVEKRMLFVIFPLAMLDLM